jgi:hypothetical protein
MRCSKCNSLLKKHSPLGFNALSDEVMTFRIKDFAIVFSRRYLVFGLAIMFCVLYLGFTETTHSFNISNITWVEYLNDCSAENIIKDKNKVQKIFSQKFYGKVVYWDGYLVKASINEGWLSGEHTAVLLIKMHPTESEIYADIVLTLNRESYQLNKEVILKLLRGSHLSFNATIMEVADEDSIHHLHGHELEKLEGVLDIPYQMKNNYRTSGYSSSVEIISIVDKPVEVDHDHVHIYNETFNQTMH